MSEWVNVKDKMPNDDCMVFFNVASECHSIDLDTGNKNGETYFYYEIVIGMISNGRLVIAYDQDGYYSVGDITHWMPLPQPPQDAQ